MMMPGGASQDNMEGQARRKAETPTQQSPPPAGLLHHVEQPPTTTQHPPQQTRTRHALLVCRCGAFFVSSIPPAPPALRSRLLTAPPRLCRCHLRRAPPLRARLPACYFLVVARSPSLRLLAAWW